MVKHKVEELHKHTLNLRAGDMEAIAQLFPGKSPSVIIRRIISRYVDRASVVDEQPVSTPITFDK